MKNTTLDDSLNQYLPIVPTVTSTRSARSATACNAVVDALGPRISPRYRPRGSTTYCNIFAQDFCAAMGVVLPHWVDTNGNPAGVVATGAREMTANDMRDWLHVHGGRFGWAKLDERGAYAAADLGRPALVQWSNRPGAPGHVAVVVPGGRLAQAGRVNFRRATLADCFGSDKLPGLEWWVNE